MAARAGVESTIKRMELDEGFPIARGANIEAVYKALTEAGIVFLQENGGGVGVRLRKAADEPSGESVQPRISPLTPAKIRIHDLL